MAYRIGRTIVLVLLGASLLLSACQAAQVTALPSATLLPEEAPATMTPVLTFTLTPRPTRTPTATPWPTPDVRLQARWTLETEAAIWGIPAVYEDVVYWGSDDGNLYAVKAQDGKLQWKFATQGMVRSRPAIAEGLVYVASDDGGLYAVDIQTGQQVWRTDIGNVTDREKREYLGNGPSPLGYDYLQSSPAVVDGRVYVGSADGKVYALAADSGEIEWTFQTGAQVRAIPTMVEGTVYIGSWDKSVYALDALTGELRWATLVDGQVQTTALAADGMVYCASRKASVVALNAETGALVWEYSYGTNMWVESSPFLADGIIYIGSSGSQTIFGLDSQKGTARVRFISQAFCWARPLVVDETLYIGCAGYRTPRNGLLALDIVRATSSGQVRDLNEKWLFSLDKTLEPSQDWFGVASSPVLAEGILYFGGLDGTFYAVDVTE